MKKTLATFATTVALIIPSIALADASIAISDLSPSNTVAVGVTVFFNAPAVGFTNPIYIVSDTNAASSVHQTSINQFGGFSWTPKTMDIGSHTITITASDSLGNTASASQNISVSAPASVSITSLSASSTTPGTPITFSVSPAGYTNASFSVADSVPSSLLPGSIGASTGLFSWTPNRYDIGLHTITISVNDTAGHAATLSLPIEVKNASMTIGELSPGAIVRVGQALDFSVQTAGLLDPRYQLGDSFANTTVSNSNVTASGTVEWIPKVTDIGVHYITVRAQDNTAAAASASVTATVVAATSTVTSASGTPQAGVLPKTLGSVVKPDYVFTKKLGVGSRGAEVSQLQKLLITQGYLSGEATGYFGGMTALAVKKLQIVLKLEPVGSVGPGTRKALNAGIPSYK